MGLDDRDWYREEINKRLGYKSWSFGFGFALRRMFGQRPAVRGSSRRPVRSHSELEALINRSQRRAAMPRWLRVAMWLVIAGVALMILARFVVRV
jgi:hypothetical protein